MAASSARYGNLVTGLAQLRDRLDVVPVAMGLDDLAHPEVAAQLQELLVLVGGVDEQCLAALATAHHKDVVVERSDDHLVDLDLLVLIVHDEDSSLPDPVRRKLPRPGD